DAHTNPVDTTMALARGARARGVQIFEDTTVTAIRSRNGRVSEVVTEGGRVACDTVVNCAGMWAREVGRMCDVVVPLHAAEHFYVVSEPVTAPGEIFPTLRDPDSCLYVRGETGGKLLVGFFEPVAKPWGSEGIPADFSFGRLTEDWQHLEPQLEAMLQRVPALEDAGIELLFNGPESFTPDDSYLLGEAPELDGFFVAAGFNSIGIQSAGGAGKVLADWIIDGHSPMDLWDVDIARMQPFQASHRYLHDRTVEGLGLLYAMHWPYRQYETARGARRSPLHDRLAAAGACFGELAGWERPNWYGEASTRPAYAYTYGRQNWFEHSAIEHRAVREAVGLFDQTSFSKLLVQGRDAARLLNHICANEVDVENGRVVYTQWLNARGGVEADLTVNRLADDRYLVVAYAATQRRDLAWLRRHTPPDAVATVTDVTSAYAVLSVMGPHSRDLLSRLSDADLTNEAFPFGTSREIELGYARVRASRLTYVGELGWELYIPCEQAATVYDLLITEGESLGLRHAGYHALGSLRMEKAYREWGHDVSPDDTPLEAGLGFAVAWDKAGGFVGREALAEQKERGLTRRLVQFALEDPEPLLFHDEPIVCDGRICGYITSGAFGHTLGRSLGMGYVEDDGGVTADRVRAAAWEIEVAGSRFPAEASLRPFFDPKGARLGR
ncbi:MAG: FAD-dependent oxidoreductase, partial [Acidobacteriota bacterium]|nr:FAD-dependent oxidoreductase [Acidobacteriota bacterium]